MAMRKPFQVEGHRAASGNHYVRVSRGDKATILPLSAFDLSNKRLSVHLAQAGMPIINKDEQKELLASVGEVSLFQDGCILERVGWNGKVYAMFDGSMVPASNRHAMLPVAERVQKHCQTAGNLDRWKIEVADAVSQHPILAVLVMAMFLPPLMRFMPHLENVVLELVGKQGTGKSTAQRVAASVVSDPGGPGREGYGITLDELLSHVEEEMAAHSDHPMILGNVDVALLGAGKSKLQGYYKRVAHGVVGAQQRLLAFMSGRQGLKSACGVTAEESCTILLPIPEDQPYGVFAFLPEGYRNGAALAEQLSCATRANHGHAYRHFVEELIASLDHDHKEIKSKLDTWQATFLEKAVVDDHDSSQHQGARVFAAIYAAGMLAQRLGALPKAPKRLATVQAVYDIHRKANARQPSFSQRLRNLVDDGSLLQIERGAEQKEQIEAAKAALGTVRVNSTRLRICIPPERIAHAFPDWALISKRADVRALLKVDDRNLKAKGCLAPGMKQKRIFQFDLPLEPEAGGPKPEPTLFDEPAVPQR